MYKLKIIILLFLLFASNIFAVNIDSLKIVINTSKNDTEKLYTCKKIAENLFYSQPDTAKKYFLKGLTLSEKLNLNKDFIQINTNLGILLNETGKLTEAKQYFEKAYKKAIEISDTLYMIKVLGNIGNMYMINGEYEKSLKNFNKVRIFFEKTKNKSGLANIYGAIGNLYTKMGKYKTAISFYEKAKKIFIEINAPESYIATTNLNEGIIYKHLNNFNKAEKYLLEAFKIFHKNNNLLNKAKCVSILGNIYLNKKKITEAKKYYLQALNIYKKLDSKTDISTQLYNIGSLELKLKNYNNAETFLIQAYNIADSLDNFYLIKNVSELLLEIYKKKNDYKNAFKYSLINKQFSDSILNTETSKKIAELEIKYQTTEKNKELQILAKNQELLLSKQRTKNFIIISIVVLFILSVIIFILIFNRQKLLSYKKELEINQKLYRLQMNPHFIFNTLHEIQQFLLNNDTKETYNYLNKLSRLMRLILQSTKENYISLDEEIKIIENYLSIYKLLNNNKFEYKIHTDDKLNTENLLILPLLIQPFIENSIKHGFSNINYTGLIEIFFNRTSNNLIKIIITDNGKGLLKTTEATEHKSMAIDIIKNRLKLIFNGNLKKAKFKIETTKNNNKNTTTVSFYIPLIEIF